MNVTFRQLKVFEAVARHRSFTRASEELFLSQPAVSMQVKQLEENLGLRLFEHLGKKIYLSEAGREMHEYSRRIAYLLNEADGVLQDLKGVQSGHLKLSVASTVNHFATRLLAEFSRRYNGVSFSLDVTNRQTLLHQLSHNECDLVIMGQPPEDAELVAEPFLDNPLVPIAAANHRLAGMRNISLEQLVDERFVTREPGSGTRDVLERFMSSSGMVFSNRMEMSSNEAIKQAVEAGLGLAVVSLHTLEMEVESRRLRILDVQGFPLRRRWYLAHHRGKRLSPVAESFRSIVMNEATNFQRIPELPV